MLYKLKLWFEVINTDAAHELEIHAQYKEEGIKINSKLQQTLNI